MPRSPNLGRVGASHEWDAQTEPELNNLTAALAADRVYESVGALAADLRVQLAALEASPEVPPMAMAPSRLQATPVGPPRAPEQIFD